MMRKTIRLNQSGFTLFEMIVVLILLGIMAVGLTLGLVRIVESYVFTQEATEISQKAQLAMARIKKELTDAQTVTYISGSRIDYTRAYAPPSCMTLTGCSFRIQQKVKQTGGPAIYLEGVTPAITEQILIDQIANDPSIVFLTYTNFSGTNWSLETNYAVNNLARINVTFAIVYGADQTMTFNTTINPRAGAKLNIPKLN